MQKKKKVNEVKDDRIQGATKQHKVKESPTQKPLKTYNPTTRNKKETQHKIQNIAAQQNITHHDTCTMISSEHLKRRGGEP